MHNTLDRREAGIQGDLLSLENPPFHSSSGCAAILTHSIDIPGYCKQILSEAI